MDWFKDLDMENIPEHIAIIMDGNGRWAKANGKPRVFGHKTGVKSVRVITEACAKLGVKYLTLYAFSTENWNRPKVEVGALMSLLVHTMEKEIRTLMKNNIRLLTIGDISHLPEQTYLSLQNGITRTAGNTRMDLILALNYSGQADIVHAARKIAEKAKAGDLVIEDINCSTVSNNLSTAGLPQPDLLIRTSGELRLSNFLLWELAYTELFFTPVLWPDFREEHLEKAIKSYQERERRFGKTGDQLAK